MKKKQQEITEVVFRKFKDGAIIALFPYVIENFDYSVMSYMHLGQHGGASYQRLILDTKPATEAEYNDLKRELENLSPEPYRLRVIKKYSHNKFLDAYREFYKKYKTS